MTTNLLYGLENHSAPDRNNRLYTADYSIGSTARKLTTQALRDDARSYANKNKASQSVEQKKQTNHNLSLKKPTQAKQVYQCMGKNGQSIFSDQPCTNIIKVTSITQFKPNIADHYQPAPKQKADQEIQASAHKRNKANAYEINTRYDNLRRTVKSLMGRNKNTGLLLTLERDRNTALAMYAKHSQKHLINQRYDNLIKQTHRKKGRGSYTSIRQLLSIERARNDELYSYQ